MIALGIAISTIMFTTGLVLGVLYPPPIEFGLLIGGTSSGWLWRHAKHREEKRLRIFVDEMKDEIINRKGKKRKKS